jgi:hypothetical protein
MRIEQQIRTGGHWDKTRETATPCDAQLVLAFATTDALAEDALWNELHARHPRARIVGCSTAGEISGPYVFDDCVVATAIAFEHGRVEVASALLADAPDSRALGTLVAERLPRDGLVHVLVLSDGISVNGSALVAGITAALDSRVAVTGGLSADGAQFKRTAVCLDAPQPSSQVVAIGLYGDRLRVGYGSLGGWDPFGPERRITRSKGNVLYELDGEPALDLYKRYLGEHAATLPASGLMFPLTIRASHDGAAAVVRTILSVDEVQRTLTFAGDVPQGHRARLMRANVERLVDGASGAAKTSVASAAPGATELAILISCVGRKLVLKQRVEEEVEAVCDVLGERAVVTGFYSYGEIAPFAPLAPCELHNQTMTITTLSET